MKIAIVTIIFLILIFFDKGLTLANMIQVNKHFPEAMKDDIYKIERNPAAKALFEKFGLSWGTIFYAIITLFTLYLAWFLLGTLVGYSIALYIICIVYGFVIANNFYFLFKYSGLIP